MFVPIKQISIISNMDYCRNLSPDFSVSHKDIKRSFQALGFEICLG